MKNSCQQQVLYKRVLNVRISQLDLPQTFLRFEFYAKELINMQRGSCSCSSLRVSVRPVALGMEQSARCSMDPKAIAIML